jgi:hypothetical protein
VAAVKVKLVLEDQVLQTLAVVEAVLALFQKQGMRAVTVVLVLS